MTPTDVRERCAEIAMKARAYGDQYGTVMQVPEHGPEIAAEIRALDLPLTSAETRQAQDPISGETVTIRNDLVRRLRGEYACGPTLPSGEPEFGWRRFGEPSAINLEAASEIERLTTLASAREVKITEDMIEAARNSLPEHVRKPTRTDVQMMLTAALASAPQPACVGSLPWIVEWSNAKIDWTPIASFQHEEMAREYSDACDRNPFQEANRYRVRALSPAPSPQAGVESIPIEVVHTAIRKLGSLYGAAGHDITQARPEDVSLDGMPIIGWRKAYREGIKDASGCVLAAFPEAMHADLQAIAKTTAQEEFDRCSSDPSLSARREG